MPPTSTTSEQFLQGLGSIHESVRGDGRTTLKRILNTCEEMLRDRKCTEVHVEHNVLDAIEQGNRPVIYGTCADGSATSVYIHVEEKVGIKFARALLEAARENESIVIVSLEGPTPFIRKECDDKKIQFMNAKDVCVNKTRHFLVPKHEKVESPPDGVLVCDLPKISEMDPIVQYYNFEVGSILKMMRTFGGHEKIPYYRVVTAASS